MQRKPVKEIGKLVAHARYNLEALDTLRFKKRYVKDADGLATYKIEYFAIIDRQKTKEQLVDIAQSLLEAAKSIKI